MEYVVRVLILVSSSEIYLGILYDSLSLLVLKLECPEVVGCLVKQIECLFFPLDRGNLCTMEATYAISLWVQL